MEKYAVIPEGTDMSDVVDLTIGKRYEILNTTGCHGIYGMGFNIINNDGWDLYCLENLCSQLNDQNWEIQESDRHNDISANKLKAVSVLLFVLIVAVCLFGG